MKLYTAFSFKNEISEMNLRKLREKCSLTREQAAVGLNIAVSTLHRWESGQTSPTMEQFAAIKRLYKLTQAEVMALINDQPGKEAS